MTSSLSVNGLGPLEALVLTTLLDMEAGPVRLHRKTASLLHELERGHGIWPHHAHPVILALARPWVTRPNLIDHHGNAGSPDGDLPAHPRYTEVRLTPLGEAAARAERSDGLPMPLGLVLGNAYAGGSRPAFDPSGVVAALLALRADPGIGDAELHGLLGPPVEASSCEVTGPVERLLAGEPVDLQLRARIVEEAPGRLVVSHCPSAAALTAPWSGSVHPIPAIFCDAQDRYARQIHNESDHHGQRYVLELAGGVDKAEATARLRTLWPLAVEVQADLGAPWRQLALSWLAQVAGVDDLAAHLAPLAAAGQPT